MKITPIKKTNLTPIPDQEEVKKAIARPYYVNTTIYDSNSPTKEVSEGTIKANIELLKLFKWMQDRSCETNRTYQYYYLDTHGCQYVLRNRQGPINADDLNEIIYNYNFDKQLEEMLQDTHDSSESGKITS